MRFIAVSLSEGFGASTVVAHSEDGTEMICMKNLMLDTSVRIPN